MKKRIIWLVVALVVALLVVAACIVWEPGGPPEPMYQGKPLSEWYRRKGLANYANQGGSPTAYAAYQEIGTNAIPTLLRWLRAKHSPLKAKLADLSQRFRWIHYDYWNAFERNRSAQHGFAFLGPAAAEAVPEIMEIFGLRISEESQEAAAWSLGHIGSNAAAALPMLEAGTKDSSARARAACVWALGEIRTSPVEAVRCVTQALADQDIYVRVYAANSLSMYGDCNSVGKPAIPALVKALSDPNESVNAAAEHALKVIDPAALEQARKEGKVRPR